MNCEDVLSFWFHEIEPSQWWVKDASFDRLIKQKFLVLHQQANCCELFSWRATSRGRLAEIIILDQFSRNIFRDQPQAFASDPLALSLAQEALSQNADADLTKEEKSFLYLPFMHSESLKIHDVALKLYKDNGDESNLEFEIKHRDIIKQFGRYPHRNKILNRESSEQELLFLSQPDSSF